MRTDRKLRSSTGSFYTPLFRKETRRRDARFSLSGNERNHLFLSNRAEQFSNISGVSGLDHPGDSRVFTMLDYDRDGWQDIALVNSNAPLLQLFRNQIGDRAADQKSGKALSRKSNGQMLALRFAGGNDTAEPSTAWSNRDGIGVVVKVAAGDLSIKREYRAGEGYAAQNSATMIIGIGDHQTVDSLIVRWPSGRRQKAYDISSSTLVTVYENPDHSPDKTAFLYQPYQKRLKRSSSETVIASQQRLPLKHEIDPSAKIRLYTTMATWCASCKSELPNLKRLKTEFPEGVEMFGVPVDEKEGTELLTAYLDKYKPVYELLMDLKAEEIASLKAHILESLKIDGLPATIVTDREGTILRTMWGVPSVSEVRRLLNQYQL